MCPTAPGTSGLEAWPTGEHICWEDAVRPKLAIIALAVGLLAPFASVIVATPAAWALNCDINSDHHTFGSFFWTRTGNDVYGVRAPIQKRVDGQICSDSTADPAINWSSIWISIFQSTPRPQWH